MKTSSQKFVFYRTLNNLILILKGQILFWFLLHIHYFFFCCRISCKWNNTCNISINILLIGLFENLSWLLYKSSGISPSLLNGIPLFATVYPEPGSSIQKLKEIISPNYMIRFEMYASLVELHSENVSCWHFDWKALNKGHIFVSLLTSLQKSQNKTGFVVEPVNQ